MSEDKPQLGRRERNKQEKLERITAAATQLFAKHGVADVTTQQIAEAADIGTGTLFLYAKTKGELLLLVQNNNYAAALARGKKAAAQESSVLDAVMALVTPVIQCNRVQVSNGRTYLQEMVFGDPNEPHHAKALEIVGETEQEIKALIMQYAGIEETEAAALTQVVSATMFVTLSSALNKEKGPTELIAELRGLLSVIFKG
ncbi:TetR/AcrR family transcriptional regulator [Corynebacterium glutamicum]|uniref:TetR/AcrR family transcriptional regulator n=1 Tax=Corynebacterium TaxID=1716 RepID=UPI00071F986A|nr:MULTISPECIES: TetR/AcrR family transcriptional regulator [Corynebacterium]ALP49244.1 TetR family transcriptional regulator [Corynebacterium glutamicum]ANR61535.1 TetR family transcriptional regulator [[Brevibacterium] flavum ZL-1]ANR64534.1 TetR family transcriptional regulator [Corynebacterium glutamicum ZL-6]APT06500.1 TetR family transcriptional regulator [Corynebacterium glutamicum]OKX84318.1 TetR family transcriptional regulator [Corynebacterium glutamicum]